MLGADTSRPAGESYSTGIGRLHKSLICAALSVNFLSSLQVNFFSERIFLAPAFQAFS